jgi:rubrerythrin
MPKANDANKAKIISELTTMKSYELSARDLYREIAGDPQVVEPKIRSAFVRLAEDEHRHAELVQEIIDLVENTL